MLNHSASLPMSTIVLKALPGKLNVKRHSSSLLYFCYYLCGLYLTEIYILQRLRTLMAPERWGPGDKKYQVVYETMERPRAHGFVDFLSMNLLGQWSGNTYVERQQTPMQMNL